MKPSASSATLLANTLRASLLVCGMVLPTAALLAPAAAAAQDNAARIVEGKVTGKDNEAIKGAVVYLKDGRTLAVKSYISGDDGGYRFGQISGTSDYTLWAESAGKKSSTKTISSFDTKKEFNFILKVDK
ncbi:MAG: carboxypeptidase-like regulatory domain-containing protein [Acidobacteriota bacterium]|nr:carboxypeptidase-like regulatory domain-containing protein [Acidobacteriota bacterium]